MKEYKQFVVIPDYLYNCRNLDNDERLILGVVISYEKDNKKLYMSKDTFAETYGMAIATVKRRFASLIKEGILVDTGKGLIIDWNELDFRLSIKKVIKTRKKGPGRKPKQNQVDTMEQNHVELTQNHVDTNNRITLIPSQNHGDTELIKLEKELKKEIKDEITSFDDFRNDAKKPITDKELELAELDNFLESLDI